MRKIFSDSKIKNRYKRWMLSTGVLVIFCFAFLVSCEVEESYTPKKASKPVLEASSEVIELEQQNNDAVALTLTWTPGTNHGTNAAIDYRLQLDKKGNSFASPIDYELGRVVYKNEFKVSALNDLLLNSLGLPPGQNADLEFRVVSTTADASVEPDYSNIITVTVTPYSPVPATLYMVGSATPNGWDNNNPTLMTPKVDDPTTFIYQGELAAGEFKFLTTPGTWLPSYQKGVDDNHIVLRTEDSQPDDKFTISQSGTYIITVSLTELTISIENLGGDPPYDQLWIVGDATPNGWNIDSPNEMMQDPNDPFIFKYSAVLNAGEFKIPTTTGNWGTDYYMPLTNHPEISATSVQLVPGGSPDNKWLISTPGAYKITLNLRDNTINISAFTPYTQLWIIGDAGPNGWNIDSPATTMTVDSNDPHIYTYEGPLSAGEFKIALGTGNWCGEWIRPLTNHPALTDSNVEFNSGCEVDNKWVIETAGNYKIMVNQLLETITIEPQ